MLKCNSFFEFCNQRYQLAASGVFLSERCFKFHVPTTSDPISGPDFFVVDGCRLKLADRFQRSIAYGWCLFLISSLDLFVKHFKRSLQVSRKSRHELLVERKDEAVDNIKPHVRSILITDV